MPGLIPFAPGTRDVVTGGPCRCRTKSKHRWSTRHVRLSAIAAGVPTPLPRRARLCGVSGGCPLAGRLQVSACDRDKGWELATKAFTWECAGCGKQTSVAAGTVMHGSKVPLVAWFWAAYLMATHSNGISALQVQKQLGLGSYKTAWLLCAKLRRAMVAPDRPPLNGLVEIDETEIPQRSKDDPPEGGLGRSGQGKMLVAGAVEVHGHRPGRVRLAPIADFSAASLHAFINANIAAGATAKTDGWSAYPGAPGITHPRTSSDRWPRTLSCPGHIASSPTSNAGRSASTTACAASTCNPTSTSSCSASIAATPAMPPSARCSASASPSNTSPTTC